MSVDADVEVLRELVRRVVSDYDPEKISDDTDFSYDLGMSSLSIVSLVFLCEEEYSIALSPAINSIKKVSTFGGLRKLIASLKADIRNET